MPPNANASFEIDISREFAFFVSAIALSLIGASITTPNGNFIFARKGISFLSNEEILKIHITQKQSEESCNISITSTSSWATTLMDWGVNKGNVQKFEQATKQLSVLILLLEKQKA